ncbi:MAG: acyl-ACP--UDP-N-acetylglucosamine O-acyltransferase [Bacteroidales bacterium]|nr:acyl-ACP--UDP-N-acetylglucosamine O-acyltransferase [Bacteroidales bacterium]
MNQPLAYIHPNAKIAEDVKIEPFAWIGEDVEIGEGTWIGPNVTIMDGARIGKNCKIFPGAVISAIPQDLKYHGELTYCFIGDGTTIRESATVNKGTEASGKTVVGKNCLLMAYTHVAHDCFLGDNVIMANAATLAGHITVGDWAIFGGLTAVSQFVTVGAHAMTSGGAMVNKDIPPFVKTTPGFPVHYMSVNSVGLSRRAFSNERIAAIQDIYRAIYNSGMSVSNAVQYIKENMPDTDDRQLILDFIQNSKLGIIKGMVIE